MPQPLRKLVRPGTYLGLRMGLEHAPPNLCVLAMSIISQWATVERDLTVAITSIMPGKAAPIAALFKSNRADSPKKAIRNALAMSLLLNDELPLFEKIMARYETCYKLRNPLAHWSLATCRQIPDVIVAIDPEDYIQISAEGENEIDLMVREMASEDRPSLRGPDRLSDATIAAMMPTYERYIDVAKAYREKDLTSIHDEIAGFLTIVRHFRMVARFRCLNVAMDKRAELLRQLSEKLGLSQPTAETAGPEVQPQSPSEAPERKA